MEENTTKKINLSKYSAMAGAIIASGSVNSQIVYTDVAPDRVIDKNSLAADNVVDLNNDATPDVFLVVYNTTGTFPFNGYTVDFDIDGALAMAPVTNGLLGAFGTGTASSTTFAPTLLANGNNIGPSQNFGINAFSAPYSSLGSVSLASAGLLSISSASFTSPVAEGNFIGSTDAFLGVEFMVGAATHYGWVRFDVSADAKTITLKDYAYNTVADGAILAGQMLNLDNVAVENKVTIKTQLDEAMINVTPDLVGGELVIMNMAGQEVKSSAISEINSTISYSGLDTGIYMIVARFEAGSVTKKIYVR